MELPLLKCLLLLSYVVHVIKHHGTSAHIHYNENLKCEHHLQNLDYPPAFIFAYVYLHGESSIVYLLTNFKVVSHSRQ